jgi:hypothetical protein
MTNVPSAWLATWAPSVCSRHGEPATVRLKTRFISRAPGWALPLIIFGGIVYLIVVSAVRKTVWAQNWGYCPACISLKNKRLYIGLGVLAVGAVLFVLGIAVLGNDDESALGPLTFLVGMVLFIVGLVVSALSGRTAIAGGMASMDGVWVQFRQPAQRFVAEVDQALAVAKQAQAAQWGLQPAPAQPQYGQPQYGQPQYGQPQYGQQQPQYGQQPPQYGQQPPPA